MDTNLTRGQLVALHLNNPGCISDVIGVTSDGVASHYIVSYVDVAGNVHSIYVSASEVEPEVEE